MVQTPTKGLMEAVLVRLVLYDYNKTDHLKTSECPSGCALCTGPMNSNCLACIDPSLYIDTTNKLDFPCSADCPNSRGVMAQTDQSGRRRCISKYHRIREGCLGRTSDRMFLA